MQTKSRVGRIDTHLEEANLSSPYLTRRETAAYLNVSEKWLAQSGRHIGPNFYKFGNHCRYRADDVLQWARQQQVKR